MSEHTASSAPNVDSGEIAKFEAMASRWWDPNAEFKPLHDINPLRLNWIDERSGLAGKNQVLAGSRAGAPVDELLDEGRGRIVARARGTHQPDRVIHHVRRGGDQSDGVSSLWVQKAG